MRTLIATCRTAGCGNADAPITLEVDDDVTGVLCGVCGTQIDDVTES